MESVTKYITGFIEWKSELREGVEPRKGREGYSVYQMFEPGAIIMGEPMFNRYTYVEVTIKSYLGNLVFIPNVAMNQFLNSNIFGPFGTDSTKAVISNQIKAHLS